MPLRSDTTLESEPDASRKMSIRFASDDRFFEVVRRAVEIYMRPICGADTLAPEIAQELIAILAASKPGETCVIEVACHRPELETTVTVGDQSISRRWKVEAARG